MVAGCSCLIEGEVFPCLVPFFRRRARKTAKGLEMGLVALSVQYGFVCEINYKYLFFLRQASVIFTSNECTIKGFQLLIRKEAGEDWHVVQADCVRRLVLSDFLFLFFFHNSRFQPHCINFSLFRCTNIILLFTTETISFF